MTGEWHKQAICRNENPELFFPQSDDITARRVAIAICKPCPVRAECLAEAAPYGVWGGVYFGRNEDGVPKGRPQKPREHGTTTGYRQHFRDGDEVCDLCRDANRERERNRRRRVHA